MSNEVTFIGLTVAALTIAFFHTVTGPDHYLPFIMIAKTRQWSFRKTFLLTLGCGTAHVISSILIGMVGIAFGVVLNKLEWLEGVRGSLAAWVLIAFGLVYMVWGIKHALRNRPHEHRHEHEDGNLHSHTHRHHHSHSHLHLNKKSNITPWSLFIIFVLGPCEPLIPLLMAPASQGSYMLTVWVGVIFSIVTIGTMLGIVTFSYFGLKNFSFKRMERYSHALAGGSIFCCGLAIQFLGL
jgi:sulfite exporter TauE/SafE